MTGLLAWKIANPLAFFVKLQSTQAARDKLAPLVSEEIAGTIGRYRMDQLVNSDKSKVKLASIENEALAGSVAS